MTNVMGACCLLIRNIRKRFEFKKYWEYDTGSKRRYSHHCRRGIETPPRPHLQYLSYLLDEKSSSRQHKPSKMFKGEAMPKRKWLDVELKGENRSDQVVLEHLSRHTC